MKNKFTKIIMVLSASLAIHSNLFAQSYWGTTTVPTNTTGNITTTVGNIGTSSGNIIAGHGSLNVATTGTFGDDLTVGGTGTFANALTVGATGNTTNMLTVNGAADITNNLTVGGTSNLTVGGNGSIANDLTVGGTASVGNLSVAGTLSFGTLTATKMGIGTLTPANDLQIVHTYGDSYAGYGLNTSLQLTGNGTFGSVLGGPYQFKIFDITVNSTIGTPPHQANQTVDEFFVNSITSTSGLSTQVGINKTTANTTLDVGGTINGDGALTIGGTGSIASNLTVGGTGDFTGNVTVDGTSSLTVGGISTLNGLLTVNNAADITNNLTVGGTGEFTGNVTVDGTSSLTVGGTGSIGSNLTVGGSVAIGAAAIGNMPTGYDLYVASASDGSTGGILTSRVKVALPNDATNWSDFVFNKDYKLMPLNKVESYLKENKHLPDIPSATEVAKDGIDVASMDAKLLQKIEELTLYVIELKKDNEQLKKEIEVIQNK